LIARFAMILMMKFMNTSNNNKNAIRRNWRAFWAAVTLMGLAACGGGGGGGDTQNIAPATGGTPNVAAPVPAVSGFTPATAAVGAQITVSGSNLQGVTQVRMGSISATPANVSAASLQFTVPTGAATARIEVIAPGGASSSAASLTVIAVPALTAVSASTVQPNQTLTLSGTNLDQVKTVLLNNLELPFAAGTRSAASIVVTIPATATSGVLNLRATDDVVRATAQQITVNTPVALTSFSPSAGLVGANVTLNGTGFTRVTSVTFAGSTSEAAMTARGATSMTVTVPTGATTGPITLNLSPTERVNSSSNFTVVPRISVNAAASYTVAAAGAPVTVTGTGLDQVSGVTVAGTTASVTSRTATQLVFSAPAGVACGAITLLSNSQPSVPAGNLTIGAGCATVNISGIEFAQVLSQNAGVTFQRLNPGQETWVRAYVTSTTAGRAAPVVRVVGTQGATTLGELTMTGPATLPQLAAGDAPPNTMRYDLTQTFRVQLPANWVASGVKVRVEVDPGNAAGAFSAQEATPNVGSATKLEVVVVPLVSGSNSPTMPTAAQVQAELARALPIARDQITVTIRAPYTLTAVTDGVDTSDDWENALSELDQVRAAEAPTKLHYGMVRPMVSAGIAGIGYVNPVNDNSPNLASLGWDSSRTSWTRTMVHELGHNFSRRHAPCGNVSGADTSYPYANGAMGAVPLFNSGTDEIVAPGSGATQYDVMGYCGGAWFSDYNLSFVQQFLEYQRSQGRLSVQSKSGQADVPLLVVSGRIDATGAVISSVRPENGVPQFASPSAHELELVTAAGAVVRVPVHPKLVDHADPPAMHFTARIADPGALSALRVLHAGASIGERRANGMMKSAPLGQGLAWARVNEVGTNARFEWNAAFGTATITHLANDQRTLLALKARDGAAQVDVSSLPRGGVFEIGLSDGLNVQTLTLTR
jgi:hypothetical protein